jgi:ribosomal-protein-serine acetyltransferase
MMDDFDSLVLPGARVVLRAVGLRDIDSIFAMICGSREHLETWLPWVEYVQTIDDERHIVEQWIYDMQMRAAIHLCITNNDELIGLVSTHQIDWMNQRTSIGYWISRENAGKHFTTEATAILLTHLFDALKLHRVSIQAATGNAASNAVITRLGFRLEGLLKENERLRDRYLDHNIYGMTQSEFAVVRKNYAPYLKR